MTRTGLLAVLAIGAASLLEQRMFAQGVPPPSGIGAPPGPQAPKSAQAAAPADFTGYWVSVVTEDWRWRMVTPIKGDFASIPLNDEARQDRQCMGPGKGYRGRRTMQVLRRARDHARARTLAH